MRTQKNAAQDTTIGIIPSMPWRASQVRALPNYCLEVRFLDGTVGKVDMAGIIMNEQAGVFAVLRDVSKFNQVHIEIGVVTWPDGIDLAPDAMYDEIKRHGMWILR